VQCALGVAPLLCGFFGAEADGKAKQAFVASAARLYILGLSFVGHLLLQALGPCLLRLSERPPFGAISADKEQELWELGWTARLRAIPSPTGDEARKERPKPVEMATASSLLPDALRSMALAYSLDPEDILHCLDTVNRSQGVSPQKLPQDLRAKAPTDLPMFPVGAKG